jgi:hypothetical protein
LICLTATSEYDSIVRPPIFTNALGASDPSRTPLPAATITTDALNLPTLSIYPLAMPATVVYQRPCLQQNRRALRQNEKAGRKSRP